MVQHSTKPLNSEEKNNSMKTLSSDENQNQMKTIDNIKKKIILCPLRNYTKEGSSHVVYDTLKKRANKVRY